MGPVSHIIKKAGTPTFGGVLIIFGILVSTLLWSDIKNIFVLICLFSLLSFALIGFLMIILKLSLKILKVYQLFQRLFSISF